MDDATQMLSISVEGMKFTFEATRASVEMMLKFLMALKSTAIKTGSLGLKAGKKTKNLASRVRYHKEAGKTTRANFRKKTGGAGVSYALDQDVYAKMKKYAPKAGLLFYKMESFKADGKVHILIPPEYTENLKAAMELAYGRLKGKKARKRTGKKAGNTGRSKDRPVPEELFCKESVENYLKSQGMDTMCLEEVARACKKGMTEKQAQQFDAFLDGLQAPQEERGVKGMDGKKTDLLDRKQKSSSTREHMNEIIHAVKNHELHSLLNRTDMVYAEISPEHILADKNSRDMVEVISSTPDHPEPVKLPKKNFINFENGNYLFVAPRDMSFQTEKGTCTASDIKKNYNRKAADGKNIYSEQFRKLFAARNKKEDRPIQKKEPVPTMGVKNHRTQPLKRPQARK